MGRANTRQTLVVAEKPSVAAEIAKVLSATRRGQGCFTGGGYVVTWCVGHLVGLAPPAAYDARHATWSLGALPLLPDAFKLEVTHAPEQFERVRELLLEERFSCVVNACDAGREGELIFGYVYELAGATLPVKRLWISSLTPHAITQGFEALAPGAEYANLATAAKVRSQADWLVGMNATRAVTVAAREAGATLDGVASIGRVQTPTLALIVSRSREREAFVATDFFTLRARFGAKGYAGVLVSGPEDLTPRRFGSNEDVTRVCDALSGHTRAFVERVEVSPGSKSPPKLFDLTTLQRQANTRHGLSAARTLELAQSLYEKHRLLTYPRTDSRHIPTDMAQTMGARVEAIGRWDVLSELAGSLTFDADALPSRVVDDSKVTDHHAIVPTEQAYSGHGLTDDERLIYEMVCRRMLAALAPASKTSSTRIFTRVGDDATFLSKGTQVLTPGWLAFERDDAPGEGPSGEGGKGDGVLPVVEKGQWVEPVELTPKAGHTTPPAAYTEATLLGAMERAGAKLESAELADVMKGSGLGTPATRASVIEKLIARGYIERKKKSLVPTNKGVELIGALADFPALTSPKLTARWEDALTRVAKGTYPADLFMRGVGELVSGLVAHFKSHPPRFSGITRPSVGECPSCGGALYLHPEGLYCERLRERTCTIWVPRKVAGKSLTDAQLTRLVVAGKTREIKGFTSKQTGKTFSAALAFGCEGERWRTTFVFDEAVSLKDASCPVCSGALSVRKKRLECANEACGFGLWRVVAGKTLTQAQLRALVSKRKTRELKGFTSKKTGKTFSAALLLTEGEKGWTVSFDFGGAK